MEKLRKPVIVLGNSSHGVALYETVIYSPYSDRAIRVGSSATLHPDGQINMHGTPSEEGTFNLQGHWIESRENSITLLNPPGRPQRLVRHFWDWKSIASHFGDGQVCLRGGLEELPDADYIIIFGQVLIARDWAFNTRVYNLEDVKYAASSRFRVKQIPTGNPSPIPVLP